MDTCGTGNSMCPEKGRKDFSTQERAEILACTGAFLGDMRNWNRRTYNRMAKRGGFPGGMPGNMNNLMKQAQRMQRQMEESQKEMETKEFTAASGGGAVEVTVTGVKEIVKVKLTEEVVDPEDIEMLEDLIAAAANEALRKVDEANAEVMNKMTGGLGLGGGLPF